MSGETLFLLPIQFFCSWMFSLQIPQCMKFQKSTSFKAYTVIWWWFIWTVFTPQSLFRSFYWIRCTRKWPEAMKWNLHYCFTRPLAALYKKQSRCPVASSISFASSLSKSTQHKLFKMMAKCVVSEIQYVFWKIHPNWTVKNYWKSANSSC